MESTQFILDKAPLSPSILPNTGVAQMRRMAEKSTAGETERISDKRKEKLAKDFEGVLLAKLFDQMKNTVGDWGFEKDGAAKQIQGMFWSMLASDASEKGGFGMWKDIYEFLKQAEQSTNAPQTLDQKI